MARYVKNGGSDGAAGDSDAGAWATTPKVNSYGFATSEDVYFKCGGTYDPDLVVDWAGTSGNRVVVGSYYMDGGVETIGVSGNKPIFDGGWNGTSYTVCDVYDAAIDLEAAYVTLQDIKVQNYLGRGLKIGSGCVSGPAVVSRLDVETVFSEGAVYDYGSGSGTIIEDSTFTDVVRNVVIGCTRSGGWPAGVNTTNNNNVIFRRNVINKSGGEGIVCGTYAASTSGALVEDNTIVATYSSGIGGDGHSNLIVRRNLVYGTTDTTYHKFTGFCTGGIGVGDEIGTRPSSGMSIYNNLVAYSAFGLTIDTTQSGISGLNIFHNTIVDCGTAVLTYGSAISASSIRDNIFADYTGTGVMAENDVGGGVPASGITWGYNNWHRDASTASGTGDVVGNPLLSKTSGWRSIAAYGGITAADFALTASSPGRGTGIYDNTYSPLDYNNVSRSNPPDIGAIKYVAGGGTTALTNGVQVTGLSGSLGEELHFSLEVPAGASNLYFEITGVTVDADLYVRFGAPPTLTTYDCRPYLEGSDERCDMPSATEGTWYVMVQGYTAFYGVTLIGSYNDVGNPTSPFPVLFALRT